MADVQVKNIPAPAFFGLAKDRREFPLDPEWAAEATNIIIDATGRLSARKGWAKVNPEAEMDSGADVLQIHEFVDDDGSVELISSTADDIFTGTSSPTSINGTLTPSDGNWKFINFNGYCLGWQAGETPIAYSGSGDFADITAATGTLPDGNTACAAFGRVWAVDDDGQTIRYCALLDHTKWDAADGGGSIDMRSVWTQGMDTVVAIVAFGSQLVVFGKRHIIFWADGSGSQLGISPDNMYVTDTVDNVGAVARDAVVIVGEIDVVFWSQSGIRSLVRTVQERASPVSDLSPNNRSYVATGTSAGTASSIRGAYSPDLGLVLFTAPTRDVIFAFDVRQTTQDGGYRLTEWSLAPTALGVALDGSLYFGFAGFLGLYSTYLDDEASYQFMYESGWVNIAGEQNRKQALKALKGFFYTENEQAVQFRWGVDFGQVAKSVSKDVGQPSDISEWGEAEFGIGEFGAAGIVVPVRVPLARSAEYFRLRVTTEITGTGFAMQPLAIYSKPVRIA